MTMPLAEALEVVATLRENARLLPGEREALGVVLECARQTFAAETVAKVNATTAEVLRDQPHAFRPDFGPRHSSGCMVCGRFEIHTLHERASTP